MAFTVKDEGSIMPNYIKDENSVVEDLLAKQQARKGFNIFKNEEVQDVVPKSTSVAQNAEEFKKFLLACIWEKRIPKNEIIMMNLVQNIATLNQAVKDETIPLKQALKILLGLQKVYQRRMAYLFDDSKFVLGQLEAPFKQETA